MGFIGGVVLEWYTRQVATRNDPYLTTNPSQALYTQRSGLGRKHAYIQMEPWSFNAHASALVGNRPRFGKWIFGMQAETVVKWVAMDIYARSRELK